MKLSDKINKTLNYLFSKKSKFFTNTDIWELLATMHRDVPTLMLKGYFNSYVLKTKIR